MEGTERCQAEAAWLPSNRPGGRVPRASATHLDNDGERSIDSDPKTMLQDSPIGDGGHFLGNQEVTSVKVRVTNFLEP